MSRSAVRAEVAQQQLVRQLAWLHHDVDKGQIN